MSLSITALTEVAWLPEVSINTNAALICPSGREETSMLFIVSLREANVPESTFEVLLPVTVRVN